MYFSLDDKSLLPIYSRSQDQKVTLETYLDDIVTQVAKKLTDGITVSLKDRVGFCEYILKRAVKRFGTDRLALAWTGGKDSTVILWMMRRVTKRLKVPMPQLMFIDEGNVFEEINTFVEDISKKWKLKVDRVHNKDVSSNAKGIGQLIRVSDLDKRNRNEVKRVGYTKKQFAYEPESMVGNHLMKTVAMNRYLEKKPYSAVITGIRWDEQGARQNETYFSPRGDEFTPAHVRVHPILHISEKQIWEIIQANDIPYCPLYEQGYRSLGAKGTTTKAGDKPAWEQDFEKVAERAGRQQDKEQVMARLRDLGYM
jgi:phosphoadenosine phosphosulfate reductase